MSNCQAPVPNKIFRMLEKGSVRVHSMHNLTVPSGWKIEPRRNTDQHLLYVKAGNGSYFLNGRQERLERNKVIFVSNGYLHGARQDRQNPPRIIPIRFGFYDSAEQPITFGTPFVRVLAGNQVTPMRTLLEDLYAWWSRGKKGAVRDTFLRNILERALLEIVAISASDSGGETDERINRVCRAIADAPWRRWTRAELAADLNLSEKYFSVLFHRTMGRTFSDFVMHGKIEYAEFMLKETDMSVRQIAEKLGYADQFSFSRQFKKTKGISPGVFRRR